MEKYKHKQIGYLLIVALGVGVVMTSYIAVRAQFNPLTVVLFLFLLICWEVFSSLTVEADDQTIQLQFGW